MEREGFALPLLIGGATTSAKHTAVKIAPAYRHTTVHVLDASRSVGVVDRLKSDELRAGFVAKNREEQEALVESYNQRQQVALTPFAEAQARRFPTDWKTVRIDTPSFTGIRVLDEFPLERLVEYIDWSPFFLTWELKGKYPKIFDDPKYGETAKELYVEANALLDRVTKDKSLKATGVYGFWPANSIGDDIVLWRDGSTAGSPDSVLVRFPMLRQQWERRGQKDFRSLADYIAPLESGRVDSIGAFAVTAGHGCDELALAFEKDHDDHHSILIKSVADRLAEAFAEYLHEQARKDWGFGADEKLTADDLVEEKYRGIRPAFGYPACPDHLLKRPLFDLLQAEGNAGINLTESFAMWPAASVSGLYFAHPHARYFAINRITRDQVEDYAKRKGVPVSEVERWLAPNLGYDA
jgi:5-methyltetrahydrofolate--homocysteine methyltransferase